VLTGDPFLDLMIASAAGSLVAIAAVAALFCQGKAREDDLERRLIRILTIAQLRGPGALDDVARLAREGLQ
jgi:hypothetical protein